MFKHLLIAWHMLSMLLADLTFLCCILPVLAAVGCFTAPSFACSAVSASMLSAADADALTLTWSTTPVKRSAVPVRAALLRVSLNILLMTAVLQGAGDNGQSQLTPCISKFTCTPAVLLARLLTLSSLQPSTNSQIPFQNVT